MSAIGIGDKVRTRLDGSTGFPVVGFFQSFLNPQPPRFAVVVSFSTPNAVLLGEEGQRVPGDTSATVNVASLNRIVAPDDGVRDAWLNKIVLPRRAAGGVLMSQEYTAKVVDIIAVDTGTSSLVKSHRLICRTLTGGMWMELRVDTTASALTNPEILGDR